jgi:succinyl-diaminopimelate desuccinylase
MDPTNDILSLSQDLIRIQSVTVGPGIRLDEVRRAADFIERWLTEAGVEVRRFEGNYPAILAGFPGRMDAKVMLSGHFDVVAAETAGDPDPNGGSQFEPRVEGDFLWGRGAADMKTVVATYMVWLRDTVAAGQPYPDINLLLVGNEETGEGEPMGTGHVLAELEKEGYIPELLIAGERTEETGHELWGQVCTQNRGVTRFRIVTHGTHEHSGLASPAADLTQKIIRARSYLSSIAERYLTLKGKNGWSSQIRFPFVQVGSPGVYNITPDYGELGVEIRTIPGDRVEEMLSEFEEYAFAERLELQEMVMEPGSACQAGNPHLAALLSAVEIESGMTSVQGKKMAGTSARFAPNGDGVVWGQSGIGPHSADERHFIPSIEPYYRALRRFGELMRGS